MKKWYNFETCNGSLRDELRKLLKDNDIYYELSSCGCGYHFEVLADSAELETVNGFLDSVIEKGW